MASWLPRRLGEPTRSSSCVARCRCRRDRSPPSRRALFLAGWAVVGAAAADDDAFDWGFAGAAGVTAAAVDVALGLVGAVAAVGAYVVVDAGATAGDRAAEHATDRGGEQLALFGSQALGGPLATDLGEE